MSTLRPYLRQLAVGAVAVGIGVSACSHGAHDGQDSKRNDAVDLVSLEAANTPGSSPWTQSVTSADPPRTVNQVETPNASRTVSGDQIGLYGGSTNRVVCDRDKLVHYLETNPGKAAAWQSITHTTDLRSYILGLSPVFLTHDTRLTSHGFKDGAATSFQAVLQTGTAVLVDNRGLPRVRCDSGSPLDEPSGALTGDDFAGPGWQNLDVDSIVAVQQSQEPVSDLKVIPVTDQGPWAEPPQTTAPKQDTVFRVVVGDPTAVPAPDITLPKDMTIRSVDVSSNRVTTTDTTTVTTGTTTITTGTSTTTTTSEPTTTTEPTLTSSIDIEPTHTGTATAPVGPADSGGSTSIVDVPGTAVIAPTP